MKVYLYIHCPFCVKVRLVADLSGLNYETVILANDDEKSHIDRIGSKQVPFMEKDDGTYLKESDEICKYISNLQNFKIGPGSDDKKFKDIVSKLYETSKKITHVRNVFHPKNQPDFPTKSAKDYFIKKKSVYVGNFDEIYNTPPQDVIKQTQKYLNELDKFIETPYINGKNFSWDDINVFPILNGITIMKDLVKIPNNTQKYLDLLTSKTDIEQY